MKIQIKLIGRVDSASLGPYAGKEVFLTKPKNLIGRGRECDLRILCDEVSRWHCEISQLDDEVWVRDVSSNNGTFIAGKQVRGPQRVMPWETIQVGSLLLEAHAVTEKDADVDLKDDGVAQWLQEFAVEGLDEAKTVNRMATADEAAAIQDALENYQIWIS